MPHNTRHGFALILTAAVLGSNPAVSAGLNDTQCPLSHDGAGTGMRAFAPGAGWLANLEELKLTPEQREAVGRIMKSYQTRGWDLAQRAAGIREQLTSVAPDDPGYADATEKASETAAVLAADAVKLVADARAEVHATLTDEQRRRLRERVDVKQKRWEEWRLRHMAPQ